MHIAWSLDHPTLLVGIVTAENVTIGPTPEALVTVLTTRAAAAPELGEPTKAAIRKLLKHGGFKATGRNKPASEYLHEAKKRGEWPAILNAVDVNNVLSLETGWPMSVLDADACGDALEIRLGAPGERYTFNSVGHQIDLDGLFGLAQVGGPMLGNPVKDAMHAKLDAATRRVVAALWTSREVASPERVEAIAEEFARLLREHCGATMTGSFVLER